MYVGRVSFLVVENGRAECASFLVAVAPGNSFLSAHLLDTSLDFGFRLDVLEGMVNIFVMLLLLLPVMPRTQQQPGCRR